MKTDEIVAGGSFTPELVVPTGSYMLDELLRYGGFPTGSMIHVYSAQEGAFKTSFALMGAVNMQQMGHPVGFVDAEKSLDINWAKDIGIVTDEDKWVYSMPNSGEKALEHVETMIKEHGCKVVILDSIDASQPAKYMEGEYGDSVMMVHAKLIGKFARRITGLCKDHNAIVYVINQMRTAGGQHMTYNKPSGGKGLPFYSTINIEMRRTESPSSLVGKDTIPLQMRIRRSKMGASFRDITTYGVQGKAINADAELAELAILYGLIEKKGSWFKTIPQKEGEKAETIGQQIELACEWAKEHKDLILE